MAKSVAKSLRKLADKLDAPVAPVAVEKPKEPPIYSKRALVLMGQASKEVGRSGEWKAHQVYAQLLKEYNLERPCDLRFEIEKLYQEHYRNK